jgi:thiol-disulfide isomerase/thioredoxin
MQRTGTIVTLAVMALVILAGVLYIVLRDESEIQKLKETPAAQALIIDDPAQSFTDLSGNQKNVNDHFGKIIVVTSWASWCPQCMEGIASLGAVADEYKDRDVVVLAMNRAEDRYTAERYLATVTVPGSIEILLDPSDHYFKTSTGYAMPETIIYNEDGQIDLHQRGNVNVGEIKEHLNKLLE